MLGPGYFWLDILVYGEEPVVPRCGGLELGGCGQAI